MHRNLRYCVYVIFILWGIGLRVTSHILPVLATKNSYALCILYLMPSHQQQKIYYFKRLPKYRRVVSKYICMIMERSKNQRHQVDQPNSVENCIPPSLISQSGLVSACVR